MLVGNLNTLPTILVQPGERHFVQDIRRFRPGFVEDPQAPHSGTRLAHHAFHALDRQTGLRLLDLRLLQIQRRLHANRVLRISLEQAGPQRSAGRLPNAECVLPTAFRQSRAMFSANGKTVLRGGWGMYYFHSGQFTAGLDVAAGVQHHQPQQQPGHWALPVRGGRILQCHAASGARPGHDERREPGRCRRAPWTAWTTGNR